MNIACSLGQKVRVSSPGRPWKQLAVKVVDGTGTFAMGPGEDSFFALAGPGLGVTTYVVTAVSPPGHEVTETVQLTVDDGRAPHRAAEAVGPIGALHLVAEVPVAQP